MKKAILILLLLPIIASSQTFNVFDIDTTDYPIMKAKFYSMDENGDQILNHTTADFEITENGNPAEVLSVSCPEPKQENEIYSIAMSIDISGSMKGDPIELGKITAKKIINSLRHPSIEFSLQQCNDKADIINDFTRNYNKVTSNIENIRAGGGNDFIEQLLNPKTGLLNIAKKSEGNRIAIIYTDAYWEPFTTDEIKQAIEICRNNDIKLYTIIYTRPEAEPNGIKSSLKEISEQSGGEFFDGVTNIDLAELTAFKITGGLGNDPCEIFWNSNPLCNGTLDIEISNQTTNLKAKVELRLDDSQYLSLDINTYIIEFGINSTDTIVTITAKNGTQTINDIIFEPDNSDYEIITPLPITIPSNSTVEIELIYTATDDSREYTTMEILGNYCNISMGMLKGDKDKPITQKTLELTHPNGGEEFIAGTDTIISWKGISESDLVNINFSSNNGNTWRIIDNRESGLNYSWSIPIINSNKCLIRIDQNTYEEYDYQENQEKIEWLKNYGGSDDDEAKSVVQSYDGSFIVSGHSRSNDKDVDEEVVGYGLWLLKIDQAGEIVRKKLIDGNEIDLSRKIIKCSDGTYILCGESESNSGIFSGNLGKRDHFIIKISEDFDIIWAKTFGTPLNDYSSYIEELENSNLLFVGSQENNNIDIVIYILDNAGQLIASNLFEGNKMDTGVSTHETLDGNFFLIGNSSSTFGTFENNKGSHDVWVAKLDRDINLIWSKMIGGSKDDFANNSILTPDGGLIIVGRTSSSNGAIDINKGGYDGWLVKLNSEGSIEWSKTIGGHETELITDIKLLNEESYIITGNTNSKDGDFHLFKNHNSIFVSKISKKGDIIYLKEIGGNNYDVSNEIIISESNDFLMVGGSSSTNEPFLNNKGRSDFLAVKFNNDLPPLQSDTSDAVFSIIMPEPVIQNNDIDMGEMIVGNTKDTIVSTIICNRGDAPLHVLGVDITGGDASEFLIPRGAGDFYLEKDQCQDMMFEFTPSQLGNRTAVATIRTTIGDFTDVINIRGVGIDPLIEATTDVVDFGQFELGEGKDTTVVLIKNVGADDITITETKITGPDMEQFDIITTPINFTVSPGEDNGKELELNYTAKYGGRTSSIIEFHYDGVGSPLRSILFAEGIGGEVYPQVPDAFVGERVELGLHLGRIKPEGLDEVATNFTATVSYNSTLLAPIDKNMTVTTENTTSFIEIEGNLSGVSQIATVPMKVGLGTAVSSGLVVTEFQLYDANGDSVDYQIEPGVGEFNVLGICEDGGTRLVNPNGEQVELIVSQDQMNTNATVSMNLIESGQTDLIIYDQLGNAIETAYSGRPSNGTKELNIDLSNFANGRYYIKLITPTITKTEIIEIVR